MQDFDNVVPLEVNGKKWGWHPLSHIFTRIPSLQALDPTFLWTHNNNEAITICEEFVTWKGLVCSPQMPWWTRFFRFYRFSRG